MHDSRFSELFLFLSTFSYVGFPAILATMIPVKEVVALFAGNLEADVAKIVSRNDGLLTFAADDYCSEFHKSLQSS
jgi:hypothetical protein